uniref:ATP synthase F0 subunit 6 n=1 Tax=Meloidogyne enterolobii TaxID=390850 RepID=A0A0C5AR14_MELEN|nr:ATP synthase F0 subunit 6 [Meloidogyne enterolobii]AJK90858.1 ATP synthase F0 subunit 6 [Meloidogyne enterolobii]
MYYFCYDLMFFLFFYFFSLMMMSYFYNLTLLLKRIFFLSKMSMNKNFLIFCWFLFYFNIRLHFFSYSMSCFFSMDFFLLTMIWVFSMYFFMIKKFGLMINKVEESNFFMVFFIFLVELLSMLIQFMTILVRILVNIFLGELMKVLLIYKGLNIYFMMFGFLEIMILLIQSMIFYYMLIYYSGE